MAKKTDNNNCDRTNIQHRGCKIVLMCTYMLISLAKCY